MTIAGLAGTGASPGGQAQAPQGACRGGPGGNPFAGQTPVNAMIVTGGCCHDYTGQTKVLMDTINDDPITNGLPPFVTPIDELYVIERERPGLAALATAVSPEEGNPTFPVAWICNYRGARVFGTTLGHGNETWQTNQFKELIVRGFRWALGREPVALPPPAPPARGGGVGGRGRGGVQ